MFSIPYLTSCNHCRDKKRKCDGARPACSLCRTHGVECEYRRSRRFRKRPYENDGTFAHTAILPASSTQPSQQSISTTSYQSCPQITSAPPLIVPPPHLGGLQGTTSASVSATATTLSFAPHVNAPTSMEQPQPFQPQSSLARHNPQLPSEINALSRLLAGDMYPQTQQLPQPILQGVNTFMSPFSSARESIMPEWVSQYKPEAAIISNLENIASAYQASPLLPLQSAASVDSLLFGNLTSQFVPSCAGLQPGLYPGAAVSSLEIPGMLTPVTATSMSAPAAATNVPARNGIAINGSGVMAHSQHVSSLPFGGVAAMLDSGQRSPSIASTAQGSDGRMVSSPASGYGAHIPASQGPTSPNTRSDMSGSFSSLMSAIDSRGGSTRASQPSQRKQLPVQYPDDFVPEIIRIYAREFPVELSPNVLLKVMRGIYSSTRTSLINVDIELSWCMILKGILPRILLFSYIASMARGQVIDAELMPQLPAKFDEICYEYAVKDIPLALASPSLWGALSLHMIGRYEFQSARYDLMLEHYEMAADILAKTSFHGHPFPWNNVPDQLKRTFEYDYYVYTYWVGFQWHLVCCINLDRPFNVDIDPRMLHIPTSTDGYFAPGLECNFDLMTLLPANSWPLLRQSENPTEVWFRGFNDPEYAGWRPPEWENITPNYRITVYLQRMLPLGAQIYLLQRNFSEGSISLASYLHNLNAQQELLKRWLYSLPEEFEISKDKVDRLTKAAACHFASSDDANMVMEFKELVMTFGVYHMLLVRANRVALLGMVNENTATPATTMHMQVFGFRDYYEATEQGVGDADFGSDEYGMWQKNQAFHKCRMQCYESMNILCDVVQLSFMLRLNLFTYGTTYVVIAGEMLNVLISQMGVKDKKVKWRTKTRLAHVLCLLRSLQHWAPAIYLFVYGIQALSDPEMVLESGDSAMKRRTAGKKDVVPTHSMSALLNPSLPGGYSSADSSTHTSSPAAAARFGLADEQPLRSEPPAQIGASAVPEMLNPFPPNHVINLIVEDLHTSLTTFLAPAYPVLLLKVFASSV
ncbi:hypothetical protein GGI19_005547 [Coemansia pectinata]|uniref:Zn(2)-C6 fungal-type domain-containing protein n=1 Tax=Coemansia pectinata TaxID=1052879 RepID=A0A9W8GPC6_9FUNG|nr:hypothetical protein GGI19_005547 [Coemansia pectinata]